MSTCQADADPILEATHDLVLAVGFRRTTVSEVARRAGVSRPTLYKRYPDGAALLRALMRREFAAVVEEADRHGDGAGDGRARLVRGAVRGADLLAAHPLMLRLLEVDPELMLPYVTQRVGWVQRVAIEVLRQRVVLGQQDGSVRGGDPGELAGLVELLLRGFVFAGHTLAGDERAATLGGLEGVLDRALAPER